MCVNHTCAPLTLASSTSPFQPDVIVFIASECCHILMGVGPSNPILEVLSLRSRPLLCFQPIP